MTGKYRHNHWWRDRGLLARLLAPVSIAIVIGAALQALFILMSSAAELREHLRESAGALLESLAPVVTEQAIIGDYATIEQLLKAQVHRRSDVARIVWVNASGQSVVARADEIGDTTPGWFASLAQLPALTEERQLAVGGTSYGVLQIDSSPVAARSNLWRAFGQQVTSTAAIVGVVCLLILAILSANLRTLRRLAAAADRFRSGDTSARIPATGAIEVRAAAHAYNNMASQLEKLLHELSTQRRELQTQLGFTQTLVEALPSPVYFTGPDARIAGVNRAWEQYFATKRHAAVGKMLHEFMSTDANAQRVQELRDRHLMENRGAQSYELSWTLPNGPARFAVFSKATFEHSDGKLAGVIGVITDVTPAREAEERIRSALVAKLSAENANRAKSAFLANMSHEIRTPLTAILGFSETLLDTDQTMEERVHAINTIIRSGNHLLQIINDILDLSKVEAQKLEVEQIPVALLPLVEDIHNLVGMQAHDKGINFTMEHVYPLPREIQTDPVRLKQILLNLCANAIKFTDKGSVQLRVRFDPPTELVLFEIIDTGIGLSQEQIARLFTPFAQADASTTRRYGGTGLGLYLSKLLAEKLGGTIVVDSMYGGGSHFTVSIAAGSSAASDLIEAPPQEKPSVEVALPARPQQRFRGKVLLAEDNANNQRLVAFFVKKLGAELVIAENGALAVARARESTFDVILMDMQMPVMDGITATRTLREEGYKAPIVALTANAMRDDVEKCRSVGCDDFLAKPIDRSQFFATVGKYLTPVVETEAQRPAIVSTLIDTEPELADLVRQFIDQLPGYLEELQQLLAAGDWTVLRGKAHDLKGLGGNYGFPQITALCAKLEFEIAKQDRLGAGALIEELQRIKQDIANGQSAPQGRPTNVRDI